MWDVLQCINEMFIKPRPLIVINFNHNLNYQGNKSWLDKEIWWLILRENEKTGTLITEVR